MDIISIIIPVYNTNRYLTRCMDSVFNQTIKSFEVILVDDGSYDGSEELCDYYAQNNNNVSVIHQENKGLSEARNAGIEMVIRNGVSNWITFIDSDDWIHPQFLEALLRGAIDHSVYISVCGIRRTKAQNEMCFQDVKYSILPSEKLYESYTKKIINVSACGKLYNIACFKDIRFPANRYWEDLATTYRVLLAVENCAVVLNDFYYYYYNEEGIVNREWTPKRMDEFLAYEEQLEFFSSNSKWENICRNLHGAYIRAISYSYYKLINSPISENEKNLYTNLMRKKIRKEIIRYGYKTDISFNDDKTVLELAFPNIAKIYWIFNALKDKKDHIKVKNED